MVRLLVHRNEKECHTSYCSKNCSLSEFTNRDRTSCILRYYLSTNNYLAFIFLRTRQDLHELSPDAIFICLMRIDFLSRTSETTADSVEPRKQKKMRASYTSLMMGFLTILPLILVAHLILTTASLTKTAELSCLEREKISDSFLVNQASPLSTTSSVALVSASPKAEWLSLAVVKPALVELSVVVLSQTIGLALLSKLALLLRRVRRIPPGMWRMTSKIRVFQRFARKGARFWTTLVHGYKKTSASKIVNRGKRLIKNFQHHDEEEEEEH